MKKCSRCGKDIGFFSSHQIWDKKEKIYKRHCYECTEIIYGRKKEKNSSDTEKKTETWVLALVIGFLIIVGGIGGLFYINDIYIPEQEEIISYYEEMRQSAIRYLDDWESAWDMYWERGQQAEENIETATAIYNGLPFAILFGAVIIFFGLLGKYYSTKGKSTETKEKIIKGESAKEILKKRYAKGEINKKEYEQIKKDMKD